MSYATFMKNCDLFLIVLCLFSACDANKKVYLCNETNDSIILKVQLDTTYIKANRADISIFEFLPVIDFDTAISLIKIDSSGYFGTYFISPNSCYQIDGGISPLPSMNFSMMEIQSKLDTLVIKGRENINHSFIEYDNCKYRLSVK